MNTIPLAQFLPDVSELILGCMGLGGEWNATEVTRKDIQHANKVVDTAIDIGINLFDHADIYSQGKAEKVFGQVLRSRPELREHLYIFNQNVGSALKIMMGQSAMIFLKNGFPHRLREL